jgi:ubiquinone/menaquinone biosynthesis C-methylase UbiE
LQHIKKSLYVFDMTSLMNLESVLRALADPTRLRIMRLLAHMELAVGELAQVLEQSQPRVSRHIRILCESELAEPQSDIGTAVAKLLEAGERDDCAFADQCKEDRGALIAIRASREKMAESYFARHADEWDTLRSLHAADAPVEAALQGLLGRGKLGRVLDIGTGTGRMAELFVAQASHVTGLDQSPEMLRLARSRLQDQPAEKFDLVRGDFTRLAFVDSTFDTVLLHQVLHYAQQPELVLTEAARVLRSGGRIAVVDFAAHDREELRERHAHARLGFADDQMDLLLNRAGFVPAPVVALPGSPLTVKIWTGTRKA